MCPWWGVKSEPHCIRGVWNEPHMPGSWQNQNSGLPDSGAHLWSPSVSGRRREASFLEKSELWFPSSEFHLNNKVPHVSIAVDNTELKVSCCAIPGMCQTKQSAVCPGSQSSSVWWSLKLTSLWLVFFLEACGKLKDEFLQTIRISNSRACWISKSCRSEVCNLKYNFTLEKFVIMTSQSWFIPFRYCSVVQG